MTAKENHQRTLESSAWTLIGRVISGLALAGLIAASTALVNHETRISKNEFQLEHLPPRWLEEDVQEIKATLVRMEQRLNAMEKASK